MDTTPPDPFRVRSIPVTGGGPSATSIDLPGDAFYPEGITAAPNGDLYVGSVSTGKIERVPAGSTTAAEFLAAGVLERGAVGMTVDTARGLLWVCDSTLPTTDGPGGALVGLALADATEKVRHELPDGSFCNDVIVEADGDLLVTETFVGQVFRIASGSALTADSAELWLTDPFIAPPPMGFGANGLAMVGGRLFIANTSGAKLVRLDPNAADPKSTLSVVTLREAGGPATAAVTLSGPDGITRLSDTELLVVENGFGGPGLTRLVLVTFDTRVSSAEAGL